jgi:hypothetical protein
MGFYICRTHDRFQKEPWLKNRDHCYRRIRPGPYQGTLTGRCGIVATHVLPNDLSGAIKLFGPTGEGSSFISRTVAHRRVDRRYS